MDPDRKVVEQAAKVAYRIPFNRPWQSGRELEFIADAIARGHLSGDGYYTKRCVAILQEVGLNNVLLTPSGTDALELAAMLMDFEPGDEVILPSFTFVSTANAFLIHGARPVLCDSRPDNLNIDEKQIEDLVTSRTKVICPVHYAGIGCAMEELDAIAKRHGLAIVEDNAHGLMGKYQGKNLGTFGNLAALSFHETKNFTSGEGGALIVNDPNLIERASIIREKGTNRSQFMRGLVQKYTWVDKGSSFLMSDLGAAYLAAQLESRNEIQALRSAIWQRYQTELAQWARENQVSLPTIPDNCEQPFHMFYILLPDTENRLALIKHLENAGILAVFHYVPLHDSEMGRSLGYKVGDFPVAEDISRRLLRLPLYTGLTRADQAEVITAITQFRAA